MTASPQFGGVIHCGICAHVIADERDLTTIAYAGAPSGVLRVHVACRDRQRESALKRP